MLIRNSFIYIVAKLVPGILGMATTALLTHLLPPARYGLYGLALVVMAFGSTTAFDWLGLTFLRFYQSRRGDPIVTNTVAHLFFGMAVLTGVLGALAWAAGLFRGANAAAYAMGIVMMWTYAWFEMVSRFEVAEFRAAQYLKMNLGRAVFIMICVVGITWLTGDPIWAAAGTAVGTFAGGLLGGWGAIRLGPAHFDRGLARAMLAFGLPLAASMVMSGMINSGTRLMLEWVGSTEELGLYTAAFMLVQNTLAVAAAGIASAGYSMAVRAVESGDAASAGRQLTANGSLLLAVLAPTAVGMALTAHDIASTLVGPRYVDAVAQLTPWMAAGAFLAGMRAHHLDHAFQLGKRPNLQVQVTALAAVVALGASLWLIPRMGSLGSALALTLAMAVSCVHAIAAGRHAYPLPLPSDTAWRVALACAAMTGAVLLVPGQGHAAFAARVVAGGASYTVAALALDTLGVRGMVLSRAKRLALGLVRA